MRITYLGHACFLIEGKEKIIILDDISESFDYKNKYAIIEYINDISEYVNNIGEKIFKVYLYISFVYIS